MFFQLSKKVQSALRTLSVLVIFFIIEAAYAESVFLKDGSIVQGKVISENSKSLKLACTDESKREVFRSNILRVLYHDEYKFKRYLNKVDGSVLEVYIVDEDKNSYTYRTDLYSPKETKILKDRVDSISKSGPRKKSSDSYREKEYFKVPME